MRLDRRALIGSLGGAAALAAFRADALARIAEAAKTVAGKPAAAVAGDEAYWAEIQRAFDVDRTLINLNNGGCSPAPTHVLDADDPGPSLLERDAGRPHVDACSSRGSSPCAAIWRRSSAATPRRWPSRATRPSRLETMIFGLDLKRGDEVVADEPELPAHADLLGSARRGATASS